MIEGNTNYDVRLLLPEAVENKLSSNLVMDLNFTSNLQGIISHFPKPFDKRASQEESFILNYKLLQNDQQIFAASLSERADMKLHIQNQDEVTGRVVLGGEKAAISSHKGVEITGEFDYFNLEPWLNQIHPLSNRPRI